MYVKWNSTDYMRGEKKMELRKKAEELLQKLTLEEKIGMIHGAQLFQTAGVERLGIPPLKMSDGPMGVRQEFLPSNWQPVGRSDDYVTYLPATALWHLHGTGIWQRKQDVCLERKQEGEARTLS